MKASYLLYILVASFLISCTISPQPIIYGNDGCSYCKMTIVDKQHGAELVTDKGKAFKFDAIECMLNYDKENRENPVSLFLINDFGGSGKLIDATKATYLICQNIPSPMGAYLSGFELKREAEKIQRDNGGQLFNWKELNQHFTK